SLYRIGKNLPQKRKSRRNPDYLLKKDKPCLGGHRWSRLLHHYQAVNCVDQNGLSRKACLSFQDLIMRCEKRLVGYLFARDVHSQTHPRVETTLKLLLSSG